VHFIISPIKNVDPCLHIEVQQHLRKQTRKAHVMHVSVELSCSRLLQNLLISMRKNKS